MTLPNFQGRLGAAPWSSFRLTPAIEENLAAAALRRCPTCQGKGYLGEKPLVHVCACINRPENSRKKA